MGPGKQKGGFPGWDQFRLHHLKDFEISRSIGPEFNMGAVAGVGAKCVGYPSGLQRISCVEGLVQGPVKRTFRHQV